MTTTAPTVADLRGPADRVAHLRRLPALTREAIRIVARAGGRHFAFLVVLQTISAVGVAGQLLISREILRGLVAVSHGTPVSRVYLWFALLAALTAVLAGASAASAYEQQLLSELTARYAFGNIIDVASSVDLESYETPAFHDQLQRARNSGLYRIIDMVNSLLSLITATLMSISIGVVLLTLQPLLFGFVVVAAVFPLLAAVHNGRRAYTFEYAMTPESRERLYILELLTERDPAKEIRVFDAAPFLRDRWNVLTDSRFRHLRAFLKGRLKVALLGSGAGMVGSLVSLGALVYLLSSGRLTVAAALTAALAMQQLSSRLGGLTAGVGKLIESGMFLDDFRRFVELGRVAARTPLAGRSLPRRPFGGLRVENVSFSYPATGRRVVEDVSLEVRPGEVVALVGENGSGKTTLVKLICQLYRVDAGAIYWDGVDARQLSPSAVRDEITVLFQDYVKYHLSVLDNVIVGRPGAAADDERVRAAVARTGADRILDALPHGYATRLGQQFYGGHELSIGQWQRLALARAFFRGGSFLILDEPTASLDPRAEARLFEQIRDLADGRSVLLVSHRFSTVRSADRIYVLDGGRIAESGTHDDLLARGGSYAELFGLQTDADLVGSRLA